MELAKKAFQELYPGKEIKHELDLRYSGRFKGYNASVRYNREKIEFRLSKNWQGVSEDIVIGLIQTLLLKVFKSGNKETVYINLYNSFLRKAHIGVVPNKIDPYLEKIFNELNSLYFDSVVEMPNLVWGNHSTRKFGSYDYGTDTISISRALMDKEDLIKYVLHHEMLHKKHKFSNKGTRTVHHSKDFRRDEKKFPDAELMEKQLQHIAARRKSLYDRKMFRVREALIGHKRRKDL